MTDILCVGGAASGAGYQIDPYKDPQVKNIFIIPDATTQEYLNDLFWYAQQLLEGKLTERPENLSLYNCRDLLFHFSQLTKNSPVKTEIQNGFKNWFKKPFVLKYKRDIDLIQNFHVGYLRPSIFYDQIVLVCQPMSDDQESEKDNGAYMTSGVIIGGRKFFSGLGCQVSGVRFRGLRFRVSSFSFQLALGLSFASGIFRQRSVRDSSFRRGMQKIAGQQLRDC